MKEVETRKKEDYEKEAVSPCAGCPESRIKWNPMTLGNTYVQTCHGIFRPHLKPGENCPAKIKEGPALQKKAKP